MLGVFMKKLISLLVIFMVIFSFVGCASKESKEEIVIPTTVEGRNANSNFITVTSASQIYGKWETVVVQNFSEQDTGIPGGIIIEAPYSLEVPVEYEGKICGVYNLSCDYTEFIDKMVDLSLAAGQEISPDMLWESMILAQPMYEYTSERPYIMYVKEYMEITDNPNDYVGMYIREDGSQLKITDGISVEFVFDKVN